MKIGNVIIDTQFQDENCIYSDGDIEEELLEIVKSNANYERALLEETRWPILYHLHRDRENVLAWYPFSGKEEVLEIGSGCGAITGLLSRKCKNVTCNDISLRRSKINAYKNAECSNIRIIVGNFEDIKIEKKFDLITMIGVFEYAASYVKGENPYLEMLKKVKTMLKPKGKLIIAIENKFGLKYWAGYKEDHTNRFFEGLEGYKHSDGVQTFSKKALMRMMEDASFGNSNFYYPMPDYKFPKKIFSDKRLPRQGEVSYSMYNFDQERIVTFDEADVFGELIKEDMFDFFANSYLIVTESE